MKSKIVFCLLGLFCIADINATHIIGGELTYECLNPNTYFYRINLKLYRDCTPSSPHAGYDSIIYIGVYDSDSIRIPALPSGVYGPFPQSPDLLLNFTGDSCMFAPPDICVEVAEFSRNVFLPPRPGGYILMYQRCCRTFSLLNIAAPLNTGLSLTIAIPDTSIGQCNTSPEFAFEAIPSFCAGNPVSFHYGASEPDGDSLVYSLCPSNDGTSQMLGPPPPVLPLFDTVGYLPGYSYNNPNNNSLPMQIDPAAGVITFTPDNLPGLFVFAVCVEEYRNGLLLSVSKRDFNFQVTDSCISQVLPDFSHVSCPSDLSATFEYTGTNGLTFDWDFGDGNSGTGRKTTHTYSAAGSYNVTLLVNKGLACETDTVKSVTVPDTVTKYFIIQDPLFNLWAPGGGKYYQWFLNGDTITGANSKSFTPSVSGTYLVFFIDSNECLKVTEPYNYYLPGIAASHQIAGLTIHPNPNDGSFVIRTNRTGAVSIYNCLGQVRELFEMKPGEMRISTNLVPGLYLVKLSDPDGIVAGRVVVR